MDALFVIIVTLVGVIVGAWIGNVLGIVYRESRTPKTAPAVLNMNQMANMNLYDHNGNLVGWISAIHVENGVATFDGRFFDL